MPKNYTKPPITISEQIHTLKERGLVIDDIPFAEKTLGEISYFRFAAYLRPMENEKVTHHFKINSILKMQSNYTTSIQNYGRLYSMLFSILKSQLEQK